jgi:hypothetical protein
MNSAADASLERLPPELAAYAALLRGLLGAVALHDPDGHLARPFTPRSLQAGPAEVREWAFLGWVALADLAKYLRRASPWEALVRLNSARDHAWRLWAAAHGVAYPGVGLTSVLDAPELASLMGSRPWWRAWTRPSCEGPRWPAPTCWSGPAPWPPPGSAATHPPPWPPSYAAASSQPLRSSGTPRLSDAGELGC